MSAILSSSYLLMSSGSMMALIIFKDLLQYIIYAVYVTRLNTLDFGVIPLKEKRNLNSKGLTEKT